MPKYLDLEGLKYYDQKLKDYINWESSYVVPEGGIPLTDLAEGVQQSLGKADTALQSSDIANSLSESDDSPVSASAVYTAIVEEEEVISAALNDLNSRIENMVVEETDPTVPAWAKASSKPSYTASEVGAVPTSRTINGKSLSSNITLTASDVNALPASTVIPSKLSDLTNDAGYITSSDLTDEVSQEDKPVTANAVYEYITEDEKVIASALNDLNERIGDVETTVSDNEVVTAAALNDLNSNKQNKLVSGTNIKTINNQSLLGEGNITISGGGSGDGGDGSNITEITEQNVEEAVEATDYIIVTIGKDLNVQYINEYEDHNTQYYLFYAVINNNAVALPIDLLHHFTVKIKPVIGVRNHYKVAYYLKSESDSEKRYSYYSSLVNTTDKTIIIENGSDITEYGYLNSETTPLSIEIYGMPKMVEDSSSNGRIDESNIYNYRLVSKDFEGLIKHSDVWSKFSWMNSYYIRSTQFTNGLVGIECGIPKWFINDHATFACIYRSDVNWSMRLVGFEDVDLDGYENYIMTNQYFGGVYNTLNSINGFDWSAISEDKIYDFINLIKNRFIADLGYGHYDFPYSYDFIYMQQWKIEPYDLSTGVYLEQTIEGTVHQIQIATDGMIYYFKDRNTNDLLLLVFVNKEDDKTFENGDLKYIPWLITYNVQEL